MPLTLPLEFRGDEVLFMLGEKPGNIGCFTPPVAGHLMFPLASRPESKAQIVPSAVVPNSVCANRPPSRFRGPAVSLVNAMGVPVRSVTVASAFTVPKALVPSPALALNS